MFLGILLFMVIISVLIVIFNHQNNKNTIFLSVFFILFALYGITHYVVTIPRSVFWGALLYINLTPLYLLSGPVLYFYLRNLLSDKFIFNKKDLLHFIPALIFLVGLAPYLISPFTYKLLIIERLYQNDVEILNFQANGFLTSSQNYFLRIGLITAYLCNNIYLLFRFKYGNYKSAQLPKKKKKITYRWLLLLHLLIFASVISYFYFVIQMTSFNQKFNINLSNWSLYSTGFFLAVMILSLLAFPDILYGFPQIDENAKIADKLKDVYSKTISNNQGKAFPKAAKLNYYLELQKEIERYFENDRPYLQRDFKMIDLVKTIGVPEHHIGYCLSHFIKKTLPKIKVEYRMKWAAKELVNDNYSNYTVDYIGEKSGFQSKSAFYKSFKDYYGITPQEYRKIELKKLGHASSIT